MVVHETLLRWQHDDYDQSNPNVKTFPRWPTTTAIKSILRSIHPKSDTTVYPDNDHDYFNELIWTIQKVLLQSTHSTTNHTNHKNSSWMNHKRSASNLPYETQPSFQNIYIMTSSVLSPTTGITTTSSSSTSGPTTPWQLYKYTFPNTQTQIVQDRARFMESFLLQMLTILPYRDKIIRHPISLSSKTVTEIDRNEIRDQNFRTALQKFGGIVYVVSYTDSQFCCDSRTTTTTIPIGSTKMVSHPILPILTLSAPIHCQYAFPIPTYETILYTQKLEASKRKRIIPIQFMDRYIKYPWWYRRYGQAVWRGSPTGSIYIEQNTRWKLCQMSQQYPQWIDAKFVGTTQRWPILAQNNHSTFVGTHISIRDMQRYRAIIDVDGNSWSARFGTLLCQSSVVLKVQPRYVDYFYPTLQPWEHYIPIREDLSDLISNVQFATSIHNTAMVQRIIHNANEWCRRHMTTSNLMNDMISILDTYVSKIMLPSDTQHNNDLFDRHPSNAALLIPLLLEQYNFTRVVAGS